MKKIKILFLLIASVAVDTAVSGQTTYIKTSDGNIVDTSTYANMKAEKIEKFKKIFPTKEVKVTIKDKFKEIRRTEDSIIYSYEWDIQISDPNAKKQKSFEPNDYIDKEFPLPTLTTLNKKKINIDSLKGKPTLINFWFTTCKPCIEEMPVLNAIRTKLKDSVNFVAITFEPTEKARNFLKARKFSFIQIANAKVFTDSMHMSSFPANIFLDKNGIVRKIESGIPYIVDENGKMRMGDGNEFLETLRELLKTPALK